MSRFALACSLVAALTTSALARTSDAPRFARPPAAEVSDPPAMTMPARVLDRAALRAKLIANRAANVASFRAYVQRGVFPSNTYRNGKLNVWIDESGNKCAAATMIHDGGLGDLVTRVAEQNNFIRLKDVRQGPLMSWILRSGLTQEEIVAIQEPGFMVRQRQRQLTPEPTPILVDARLRAAEDLRLARRYKQVDAMITRQYKRSIEVAVDRLMNNPEIAWQLLDS